MTRKENSPPVVTEPILNELQTKQYLAISRYWNNENNISNDDDLCRIFFNSTRLPSCLSKLDTVMLDSDPDKLSDYKQIPFTGSIYVHDRPAKFMVEFL